MRFISTLLLMQLLIFSVVAQTNQSGVIPAKPSRAISLVVGANKGVERTNYFWANNGEGPEYYATNSFQFEAGIAVKKWGRFIVSYGSASYEGLLPAFGPYLPIPTKNLSASEMILNYHSLGLQNNFFVWNREKYRLALNVGINHYKKYDSWERVSFTDGTRAESPYYTGYEGRPYTTFHTVSFGVASYIKIFQNLDARIEPYLSAYSSQFMENPSMFDHTSTPFAYGAKLGLTYQLPLN